jgi:hypothetical protein
MSTFVSHIASAVALERYRADAIVAYANKIRCLEAVCLLFFQLYVGLRWLI